MRTSDPKEFRNEFLKLVGETDSILITAHSGPDDDAIGSVLAVHSFLKRTYPEKSAEIWFTGAEIQGWDYFERLKEIKMVPDIYEEDLNKFGLIIFLDGLGASRFGNNVEKLKTFKGKKVAIDHHKTEQTEVDLILHNPDSASTAELIFPALFEEEITKEEAEALLIGIYGDSGKFKFITPKKSNALRVAADLIDRGDIAVDAFMGNFEGYPKEVFEILREAFKNTQFLEIEGWPPFTYAIVTQEFTDKGGFVYEQMKFAAAMYMNALVKQVKGYDWGFIIYPKMNHIGASFRARMGSVNVRKIVEDLKVGGGHDQAAGSTFPEKTEQEVFKIISEYLKKNPPELT